MTVPVAVVSNSLRIASLIVVADVWSVETATGWYHDTSGVLIFFAAFLLMFGIERLVLTLRRLIGRPVPVVGLFHDVRRGPQDREQGSLMVASLGSRSSWAAAMAVLVVAAGAYYLNRAAPNVRSPGSLSLPVEMTVEGRQLYGYRQYLDENTLTILETRDYAYSRYMTPGVPPVDFCVIFSQDNRKGTHPPDLCLQGSGEGIVAKGDVVVEGVPGCGAVPCRELIVQGGSRSYYYLYTYKCGSIYTRSFWRQQFEIFSNGLLSRDASGALVRVSTPVETSIEDARRLSVMFMRQALPYVEKAMAGQENLK
jgi:EpsI family protein